MAEPTISNYSKKEFLKVIKFKGNPEEVKWEVLRKSKFGVKILIVHDQKLIGSFKVNVRSGDIHRC